MPAVSKAQQRFMGMVHAAQKGEKPASKAVADVAKNISKSAAKDFAKTKQKGLPNKVKNETYEFSQDEKDFMAALLKSRGASSSVLRDLDKVMPVSKNKTSVDPKLAKLKKLREYIRKKIMQEMNVTGNVQGYNTPHAFTKRGTEKKKAKKQADLTGYSVVNEIRDIIAKIKTQLKEGTFHSNDHIASFSDKRGSDAEVYKRGNTYYVVVSGEYDYDMEASNKTELINKLKRDGFKYPPYSGQLKENRWLELKREDAPPASKIGRGISNINRQLAEVEKFLNWYGRIKQESGTTNEDFWKRTNRNIYKIKERLIKLEQQIRRFT